LIWFLPAPSIGELVLQPELSDLSLCLFYLAVGKKDIPFAVVVIDQRDNSYMFVYVYSSKQNSISTVCAVILDNNFSISLPQKNLNISGFLVVGIKYFCIYVSLN